MKIALGTVGSTGDIQPFIALALELQAAGHQVIVCSHPFHQERFTSRGIPYAACGPEVTQEKLNQVLDMMLATINPVRQLEILMNEAFFAEKEKYFREVKAAMADCDLVVNHMVDYLGAEAAEQLGKPRIGVLLSSSGLPTRHSAPPGIPDLGMLNRSMWRLASWLMRRLDRQLHAHLRDVGGTNQLISNFHTLSRECNLIAASSLIQPIAPDFPDTMVPVGPISLPEPEYKPDASIRAFLERYPRPVIVSLGSMGGSKGPALTAKLLQALQIAGLPAIVQSGYAGLYDAGAPANIHFTDYVPHGWLFRQGSCVVHHCGAGTSTAACRAGVPTVPIVFIADQPHFADQMRRQGIATKRTWHHSIRPQRLAMLIRQAVFDEAMQARARQLQPQFLAEDGNRRAVEAIERFAHQKGLI